MSKNKSLTVVDPNSFRPAAALAKTFESDFSRESAAKVGSSYWPYLNTRGAIFKLGDRKIGDELEAVLLGVVPMNQYYEGDYNPNSPQGPVCFAVADTTKAKDADDAERILAEMAPPADLKTKVSERCSDCPMNAWGSGKGRGKACKNGRRAILVGRSDDYSKTEGARLNVPPTSVKRLAEYSKKLRELGRPLISVITRINLEPSDSGGFDMYFEPAEPINDPKTLDVLRKRVSEGYESLVALPSAEARVEKAEEKSSPVKSRAQKRR